jgi:hypothetical protein
MEEYSFISGNRRLWQNSNSTEDGWVDSMVEVVRLCNNLFTKHTCGLCHIYVDKQVEYETRHEEERNRAHPLRVDLYRQFLFDEDSVSQRSDGNDDLHGRRRARGESKSRSLKKLLLS